MVSEVLFKIYISKKTDNKRKFLKTPHTFVRD